MNSHGILNWMVILMVNQSINRLSSENPCAREITGGSYTGSLTIRHIRTEHAGLYHLDITGNRRTIFKRFFISVCSQNWFRYVMVIIVIAVLLLVVIGAVVVIRRRQTQNANGSVI